MRTNDTFKSDSFFLHKALQFANKDSHVVYLNPNQYDYPFGAFKHVLAFGCYKEIVGEGKNDFELLKQLGMG